MKTNAVSSSLLIITTVFSNIDGRNYQQLCKGMNAL